MKILAALMAALVLTGLTFAYAENVEISVYAAPGSLTKEASLTLTQLLEQAVPQANVSFVQDEGTLLHRVLGGEGPHLAVCSAQEAARLAGEGLLLPLELDQDEAQRIAKAVLSACTYEGDVFMAPLYAHHRRMAVNRQMMEALQIAALMDTRAFPVWQPMQLYQVLEEASLAGGYAMEIWPCHEGSGDAIMAFMQALYGGEVMPGGGNIRIDSKEAVAALEWLCEMAEADMIRMVKSREEALENFLEGETALFIDWTDEEARAFAESGEDQRKFAEMPYPSSMGIPVRDMRVTGIAAFRTGDEEKDALLGKAAAALAADEKLARVLGERAIYEDEALWLSFPGAGGGGSVLRALTGAAVDAAIAGEMEAGAALRLAQAACEGSR